MYDLFNDKDKKNQSKKKIKVKKKQPSFFTNITAVISLSVEIPD
jgi:hypothetical protein